MLYHDLRSSPPAPQPSNVIRLHRSHAHQILCIRHMGIKLRELCMKMCILPVPVCGNLGDGLRSLLGGGVGVGGWRIGDWVAGQPVCGTGRHLRWPRPIGSINRAAL